MPRLVACSSCSVHVKSSESVCPHCGARIATDGSMGRTASAVLMGLTLASCAGDDGGTTSTGEPEYGVPATDTAEPTTSTTTTDGNTSTTSGTSSTTAQPTTAGESDYGVPDTGDFETTDSATTGDTDTDATTGGTVGEPEYGVPTTG